MPNRNRLRAGPAALGWMGWVLVGSLVGRGLTALAGDGAVVAAFEGLFTLGIALALGSAFVSLMMRLRRRVLWRVRRKLVLSYVFIGVVPTCLVVAFFAVAGAITVLSMQSELVSREFDRLVTVADLAVTARGGYLIGGGEPAAALLAPVDGLAEFPGASAVVLGADGRVLSRRGPWTHAEPPRGLPAWIGARAFAGLVLVGSAEALAVRAMTRIDRDDVAAVIVDVPVDDRVRRRVEAATGIALTLPGAAGRAAPVPPGALGSADGFDWVVTLQPRTWTDGEDGVLRVAMHVPFDVFADRLVGTDAPLGDVNVQNAFVLLLAGIGALFLVIEGAALIMGLALARSITGSVHELFMGTEQVRRGDFRHRIRIDSGDQLGDLADSFNAMTSSVEELLQQSAEKKRLEDELRIARQIQMSLLPRDTTAIPGLTITAVSRPAREVGGDYYDFIRLGEHRLGLLVADVSGKGMSAALYMAELKGLMLSLGQIHDSPKRLLIEANRIMANAMDSRSFITVLYAVFDLAAATLTYARAGHTPLMYASTENGAVGVQTLAPDGLVLGLRGFESMFESLLEERQLPLHPGDLAVLFTDGVTEAMNEADDLFGEPRLQQMIETQGMMPADMLRAHIMRDIETFVGTADQHDDMTMVLVRIDQVQPAAPPARSLDVVSH